MLPDHILYQAMLARDPRFDGRFFIGVKTTGVFCRNICPSRPLRKNVEFFPDAAAARRAGYRACLRCRPDLAPVPGIPHTASPAVRHVLRLLDSPNQSLSESRLAAHVNLTPRHLRRLFLAEVGQTPTRLAHARRLAFARKLLHETSLPIARIALAAGFGSLRRFNDAFRAHFHLTPTALRRTDAPPTHGALTLSLPYRPPLDFPHLLSFFRRHAIPHLETVIADRYTRIFELRGNLGIIEVSHAATANALSLRVHTDDATLLPELLQRTRRMFDLDSDPLLIAAAFDNHPHLATLFAASPGLRLPRGWDLFEMAIAIILGQFVTVSFASMLLNDLVNAYGRPALHPLTGEKIHLFPSPETLAASDLRAVKTTTARKNTIRLLAQQVADKTLLLDHTQDPQLLREQLLTLRGIGPWTAECIALRALGDTDAFPANDLIIQRALTLLPDLNPAILTPWRGYAAIHLWHHYATKPSHSPRLAGGNASQQKTVNAKPQSPSSADAGSSRFRKRAS